MGYVILPTGEVDFDPDEQAREVIRLIFDKFDELGTIYGLFHWLIRHDIQLPVRPRAGSQEGATGLASAVDPDAGPDAAASDLRGGVQLWSASSRSETQVFARQPSRPWVPMEQWKVLHKDRLPAYITWERYLKNRERIKQNRNRSGLRGRAARRGRAASGRAGLRQLRPADASSYHAHGKAQYACNRQYVEATEPRCSGLAARAIDDLVAQQVLRARTGGRGAEPAKPSADVEQERAATRKALAATAPAGTLRRRVGGAALPGGRSGEPPGGGHTGKTLGGGAWPGEATPGGIRPLRREAPARLADEERARIDALTPDIPALWNAPGTTNARSETDRPLPGRTRDRSGPSRQRVRRRDDPLGGRL